MRDGLVILPFRSKEAAEQQRRLDYIQAFAGPSGERVLADLLRACAHDLDPLEPGKPDVTNYRIGQQRVARHIIDILAIDPAEAYRRTKEVSYGYEDEQSAA